MSAAIELYEIGFEDLVSVIPPGATIAPGSSVDPNQRGKCPGKKTGRGWVGYAFTKERVEPEQMEKWSANVGLLGNRFPGLDIDSEWTQLTKAVLSAAAEVLGPTAVRHSRDPRRLLVYRTEEPFARIALNITDEEHTHTIEWLGKGRQYLVDGLHPANVPYKWARKSEHGHFMGDLWDFVPEEIPLVTRESAIGFLELLKSRLEDADTRGDLTCEIVGDGRTSDAKAPPQEDLLAPSIDAFREVVEHMPNEYDERDEYITMGHAIKAAGAEWPGEAYSMFVAWADRWKGNDRNPHGNAAEVVDADWSRMQPPYRVGWTWLQEQAGVVTDDFDDLPDSVGPVLQVEPEESEVDDDPYTDPSLSDEQALRYVIEHGVGDNVRRVPAMPDKRQWYIWTDGHVWGEDQRESVYDFVTRIFNRRGDLLFQQAEGPVSKGERKALLNEARRMQSNKIVSEVVKRLGRQEEITLRLGSFDVDPWLLNTPGGVISLEEDGVRVLEPSPEFLLSKTTGVAPAKGVPEIWRKFLDESTDGDKELQRYLQKLIGYSLAGVVREQVLAFVWGPSHTGKSVFTKTIQGVLGTYWQNTSINTFLASRDDRIPAEEAALSGARLVTSNETEEGRAWDEAVVKSITGGDARTVRHLYSHPFTYEPTFQIVITGNNEPTIKNLDGAMRRRLHVIPFTNVVPVKDRIPDLPERLKKEYPQILKWALEGYVKWRREGLVPPEVVLLKTAEYFSEEDLLTQWVEECCDLGKYEEERMILYGSWEQWCNQRGYEPGTYKQFRRKLIRSSFIVPDRQIGPRRLKGNRGIRVKPAIMEGVDGDL